jgi:hypothetical protein
MTEEVPNEVITPNQFNTCMSLLSLREGFGGFNSIVWNGMLDKLIRYKVEVLVFKNALLTLKESARPGQWITPADIEICINKIHEKRAHKSKASTSCGKCINGLVWYTEEKIDYMARCSCEVGEKLSESIPLYEEVKSV